MPKLETEAFFVVRESVSEGLEWVDTLTLAMLPDAALENCAAVDKAIPEWARANPFKRIARFRITEL